MSFIYSVVGFLLAIGVLVAVHEFGHFWVARKLGVKVLRFSVGFGKPLWKKVHGPDQIEYVLAAIPLGGYVKMLGEGDDPDSIDPADQHRSFDRQPIWKRSLIVLAGPGINFLFAIILFLMLGTLNKEANTPVLGELQEQSIATQVGLQQGDTMLAVDGKKLDFFGQHDLYIFNQVLRGRDFDLQVQDVSGRTKTVTMPVSGIPIYNINPTFLTRTLGLLPEFPNVSTQIQEVQSGSAAEQAGLLAGDTIIEIDGQVIDSWAELVKQVSSAPEQILNISFDRDGQLFKREVSIQAVDVEGKRIGRLGVGPVVLPYTQEQKVMIDRSLWQSAKYGVEQTWLMSSVTLRMFGKMLMGKVSHKNVSGPITIAQVAGQAIQVGFDYYLYILAVISISLGVMNLLPIPMLDGGHLLMYAVETVAGKNIAASVFAVGQRIGIVLLICLMSLAFYNDIFRLLN